MRELHRYRGICFSVQAVKICFHGNQLKKSTHNEKTPVGKFQNKHVRKQIRKTTLTNPSCWRWICNTWSKLPRTRKIMFLRNRRSKSTVVVRLKRRKATGEKRNTKNKLRKTMVRRERWRAFTRTQQESNDQTFVFLFQKGTLRTSTKQSRKVDIWIRQHIWRKALKSISSFQICHTPKYIDTKHSECWTARWSQCFSVTFQQCVHASQKSAQTENCPCCTPIVPADDFGTGHVDLAEYGKEFIEMQHHVTADQALRIVGHLNSWSVEEWTCTLTPSCGHGMNTSLEWTCRSKVCLFRLGLGHASSRGPFLLCFFFQVPICVGRRRSRSISKVEKTDYPNFSW